jgi:hypothetical protein
MSAAADGAMYGGLAAGGECEVDEDGGRVWMAIIRVGGIKDNANRKQHRQRETRKRRLVPTPNYCNQAAVARQAVRRRSSSCVSDGIR